MWTWIRRALRLEHEHGARVVRVQHTEMPSPGGLLGGGGAPTKVTVVLYFCDQCKVSETKVLLGTWSAEDVKGIDASASVNTLLGNRPTTKVVD